MIFSAGVAPIVHVVVACLCCVLVRDNGSAILGDLKAVVNGESERLPVGENERLPVAENAKLKPLLLL